MKRPLSPTPETAEKCAKLDPLHLPELPTELVWSIASYLAEPRIVRTADTRRSRRRKFDLCALRLLCRALREKVQSVFVVSAFEELEVDIILHHLEALGDISRDPIFGPAIRTLTFAMDELWPERMTEEMDEEMAERSYVERGVASAMLMPALQNLPNLRTIKITPTSWYDPSWRFVRSNNPHLESSTTRLASIVMSAVVLSKVKLQKLILTCADEARVGLHVSSLDMPRRHREIFQGLEELDLFLAARPSKTCIVSFRHLWF
ncbi:hypothetical protein K469DRAFT_256118 [Zopfia rhizophila CBS 207.26]|uniref:F-box domain-containing protein n=1 Tax=Zopfia rhizophila CBS 207.26 TaxID=1314779 RepID=A0A6A6DS83_9PEZI|nr:hypothetical protein K469DRAFT_256118 [Zopfia rhizophila CBS 207.26]